MREAAQAELNRIEDAPETDAQTIARLRRENSALRSDRTALILKVDALQTAINAIQKQINSLAVVK